MNPSRSRFSVYLAQVLFKRFLNTVGVLIVVAVPDDVFDVGVALAVGLPAVEVLHVHQQVFQVFEHRPYTYKTPKKITVFLHYNSLVMNLL
jgi:hypothetical protein